MIFGCVTIRLATSMRHTTMGQRNLTGTNSGHPEHCRHFSQQQVIYQGTIQGTFMPSIVHWRSSINVRAVVLVRY